MPVPVRQSLRIGTYIVRQKLARRERFPLLVELEPLYQCNLACAGCGKIQQPDELLRRRMPVEEAIAAIEESGAPMVSIAGGEPLIHPDIHVIAAELIKRRKYVFLCTNALLMERKMDLFKPSRYFAWAVHIDGLRERHDESVCRDGVFDKAVAAISEAKRRGFRVTTNTTFFTHDSPDTVRRVLDFLNDEARGRRDDDLAGLRLREGARPGPLPRRRADAVQLFREAFADGRRRPLAAEPQPAVPRLPRGQGRLRLHGVGDPELLAARLAAPLLPDDRRLRQDLQELVETTDW